MTMPIEQPHIALDDLLKKPEIQASLVTLVEGLPQMAMLVRALSKACEVSKEALQDGEMLGAIDEALRGAMEGPVASITEVWQEAKQRAAANCHQTIGLFGMLRLLKDPMVQRNLHLVQALLSVMAERQQHDTTKGCNS